MCPKTPNYAQVSKNYAKNYAQFPSFGLVLVDGGIIALEGEMVALLPFMAIVPLDGRS